MRLVRSTPQALAGISCFCWVHVKGRCDSWYWNEFMGSASRSLQHSPSGREKMLLSEVRVLQPPLSEEEGKLQPSDCSGRGVYNSHLRNFFHHNQAFQEKGLKAWNSQSEPFCPAPSFITHKKNKKEDSSLPVHFISKSICAARTHLGSGAQAARDGNTLLMSESTWGKPLCHFQGGCAQDTSRF